MRVNFGLAGFIAGIAISTIACGGNEAVLRSGKETPNAANTAAAIDGYTEDLASMRTAGFVSVYVLRRRDGGKIDAADRGVIRVNTVDANRRVASDEDRAFIIGTNYPIAPEKMAALSERFAIEDRSPPPAPVESNQNTNANSNK
ncbi:MAG: hypothetical protein WKF34_01815 [Pyrinomonadaceae bacterium]